MVSVCDTEQSTSRQLYRSPQPHTTTRANISHEKAEQIRARIVCPPAESAGRGMDTYAEHVCRRRRDRGINTYAEHVCWRRRDGASWVGYVRGRDGECAFYFFYWLYLNFSL